MTTYFPIQLRRFTVQIRDRHTGRVFQDYIVLSKQQLQAAQMVGQSSKELIQAAYKRAGYYVLDISKAEKREIPLDLEGVFNEVIVD